MKDSDVISTAIYSLADHADYTEFFPYLPNFYISDGSRREHLGDDFRKIGKNLLDLRYLREINKKILSLQKYMSYLDKVEMTPQNAKFFRDGQLFILKDGRIYNVIGQKIAQ